MPQRAIVSSVEAIDDFRAALIVYLSKARPTLEEVGAEVVRTRVWLETDQRTHWENEVRRRTRVLQEAQAALFSARLSKISQARSVEQMAVHRAKRALDEAQAKLQTLKQWNREFENRAQPLVKQTEKLQTVLANDMVKAVAYLTDAIQTLQAYASIPAPAATAGPAAASGPGPAPADSASGRPSGDKDLSRP